MEDFLGKELNVGSEIVFIERGSRVLSIGIVTKLTQLRARVEIVQSTLSWKGSSTIIDPKSCVRIGGQ